MSEKITVFKSLSFSNIIFISYLNKVPTTIIKKIEQIQRDFIWNVKKPKIKHTTLINDYEEGGLKDIDMKSSHQDETFLFLQKFHILNGFDLNKKSVFWLIIFRRPKK